MFLNLIFLRSSFIDENHQLMINLYEKTFLNKFTSVTKIIELHSSTVEYLEEIKSQLTKHHKSSSISFRPSNTKEVPFLQCVPINLQHYSTKTSELSTETFTSGAIAFHQNLSLRSAASQEFVDLLSNYDRVVFALKTRQFIHDYFEKHRITIEHIPHDSSLYSKSIKIKGIEKFYEKIVEFCLQIVKDQTDPTLINRSFQIAQTNLSSHGIEFFFEDQYEPIDLTYLNIRACCVKIQEVFTARKTRLLYSDIVSVNSKLLHALSSLENILLTVYASHTFLNTFDQKQLMGLFYRKYCLKMQSIQHLLFFAKNTSWQNFKNLSETKIFPVVYESLLTSGGNEKKMLADMIDTIGWSQNNVIIQFCTSVPEAEVQSLGPIFTIKLPYDSLTQAEKDNLNSGREFSPIIFLFNMGVNSEANVAHL